MSYMNKFFSQLPKNLKSPTNDYKQSNLTVADVMVDTEISMN
jgi:hypothetical protein